MKPIHLLVIGRPGAPHLHMLDQFRPSVTIEISNRLETLKEAAPKADVILNAMLEADLLHEIFPLAQRLRWLHSLSTGVENLLSPAIIASPVPVTNARGVFRRPLAEFAIAACLFFAKDLRRLVHNQEAGVWQQFDIEEIHGRVMGIAGYGEIGRACAEKAHALGMKILALRRRTGLSAEDPLLEAVFPPERLREMLAASDYVVLSMPETSATRGLIGEAELSAMKQTAVLINVGRGSLIDETALVKALQENRIRGAALDVFQCEPLPPGHPFYSLKNLLLSPHAADHTTNWLERAMRRFVENFTRFLREEPLEALVDKHAGY
jgi:phosphoglycerate dehydrogenase-like enzyme